MGVLPLQYLPGQNAESLRLTGREEFSVIGLADGLAVRKHVTLRVRDANATRDIEVIARIDGPVELDYYRQGGIMPAVLRRLAGVTH
jgi:aconitate hydratase